MKWSFSTSGTVRDRVRGKGSSGAGFEGQAAASKTWQLKHRDGGGGQAPKPRSGARLRAGLYARRQSR
jgi:hypothetical protein